MRYKTRGAAERFIAHKTRNTSVFAISDSVWLSMSGRQFRKALSKEEEKNALQESIPKSTRYATKWAVKIFGEWQSGRDNKDPGK